MAALSSTRRKSPRKAKPGPGALPSAARRERLPLALPGMRIGLLGGSFNPPHDGHRHISLLALKRLNLDRLWWLVTPGNPLKSHADLAAFDERVTLARRLEKHRRIDVTGFEARQGFVYTVDTAAWLKRRWPGVGFVWVMGADSFATLHRWRHWRRLMTLLPVAVMDRPGFRLKALASRAAIAFADARLDEADAALLPRLDPPAWAFLSIPLSPVSSTAIRAGRRPSRRKKSQFSVI